MGSITSRSSNRLIRGIGFKIPTWRIMLTINAPRYYHSNVVVQWFIHRKICQRIFHLRSSSSSVEWCSCGRIRRSSPGSDTNTAGKEFRLTNLVVGAAGTDWVVAINQAGIAGTAKHFDSKHHAVVLTAANGGTAQEYLGTQGRRTRWAPAPGAILSALGTIRGPSRID